MLRETGSYIADDGARMYYEMCGKGEPLVLLHGNGEDLHSFEPLLPILSEWYRVILPDTRGHGKSERGHAKLTYQQMAMDVRSLLVSLGLQSAHFIGFSDGGIVALILGAYYPALCDRMVIAGANISLEGLRIPIRIGFTASWVANSIASFVSASAAQKREQLELMLRQPNLTEDELGQIESPCLIMAGEHDIIRRQETRRIAGAIPLSDLVIVSGAGHSLVGKKMHEIVSYMIGFLSDDWAVL